MGHFWSVTASGRFRIITGVAILLTLQLLRMDPVEAQSVNGADARQPVSELPATAVNGVTEAAVRLGALTCAARVQQVTSFLGFNNETRVTLRQPENPPDINSLSIAMTIATDGTTGVALAEFFPTGNGCKASYSLTVNLPQGCDALRAGGFASLNDENKLSRNITSLTGTNTLRVMLIGSGEGCTVIKSETLD
jgi:hypothetical protein